MNLAIEKFALHGTSALSVCQLAPLVRLHARTCLRRRSIIFCPTPAEAVQFLCILLQSLHKGGLLREQNIHRRYYEKHVWWEALNIGHYRAQQRILHLLSTFRAGVCIE